jgi:hypothetical protein
MALASKVNGVEHRIDVDGDTPPLQRLRDLLGIAGAKFGCGMAVCGACGVHLNGVATRACATAVDSIRDAAMTTVVLLALLGGPVAIAQTTGSPRSSAGPASPTVPSSLAPDRRLIGSVPVGHRQPHGSDVPSESPNDIEHIDPEDAVVDRKINNICRGC